MLPSLMDTPQSSCYVTSQWTLAKLTLPSFWEKPYFLGIQAPTFFCLFTFFFLLCGCISLSLCQIFLFYLTLKCWNCSGSALDPFLFSLYTLCLSQLIHFHGLISMLRALKCVQLPRHFSYLKSHSNTCFTSLLRYHKHICLELKSWSFPPRWRSCIFPLQIHSLYPGGWPGSLASDFHLGLATGKPWKEIENRGESEFKVFIPLAPSLWGCQGLSESLEEGQYFS